MESNILSILVFLPLLGILAMFLAYMLKQENIIYKYIALFTTFIQLVLTGWLYKNFDPNLILPVNNSITPTKFVIQLPWIESFNIQYFLGIDGLSMPLVLLTSLLMFICILSSWNIDKYVFAYFALFLLLDTGMIGVFLSLDFFLFYIFWEVMLLPMYFLIGIWGGPQRKYAAIKFFLYTLFGSVFLLLGMISLYYYSGIDSFNLIELIKAAPSINAELWGYDVKYLIWLALFIGFAIKVPIFPFHTWLPLAHVEAPTSISVILAGVLLKMGVYGLLRISYPLLPSEAISFSYTLAILAVINIIWGATNAIAQRDLKKMIAYSSISHMGYVLLGMSAVVSIDPTGNQAGMNGAVMQMFNHGVITAMLFLLAGMIYDRSHHRWIIFPDDYEDKNLAGKPGFGGIANVMPVYSGFVMIAFFAGLGLPGLSAFISEAFCFIGGFSVYKLLTVIATLGILLNAVYFLRAYQRIFWGELDDRNKNLKDITRLELSTIIPLTILVIALGVYPSPLINMIQPAVQKIINIIQIAL